MKRNLFMIFVFSCSLTFLSSCDSISDRTIEEFEIIDGTNTITSEQFHDFFNLKSITIPKDIKIIEQNAFSNTEKLENVYFKGSISDWCNIEFENEKSNPMFYAENFYTYEANQFKLVTSFKLPSNKTKINPFTFAGFEIDKLTIDDNLLAIGDGAFLKCNVADLYYEGTLSNWCNLSFENLSST